MMCFANFADHVRVHRRHRFGETLTIEEVVRAARSSGPAHFLKHVRTIVGPDDPVRHPARTERFDYEGEVAIVLGRSGRDVSAAELPGLIWGYVLMNDWSVRDYANSARDFGYTKNFDTAASLGPYAVVHFASDESAWVTGEAYLLDGGRSLLSPWSSPPSGPPNGSA
jgi:2-keto-4-pentenoate hydratase/2-oxohepta-3-ene-1,7-dioic acid hydratase in catechol pathway